MGANQPGKFVLIVLGWGFAVFVGASVSSAMGGVGWLNPAVAIYEAIAAGTGTTNTLFVTGEAVLGNNLAGAVVASLIIAIIFEFLGAMFGQGILDFINYKFIRDRENDIFSIRGMHSTAPAYKNKEDKATIYNLAYEFFGTVVLLAFILASGFLNLTLGAIPVAFVIMSIGISLGSATGYAINPARDLGPRMVFAFVAKKWRSEDYSKQVCDWGYSWVPVAGPMAAGVVMGLFGLINVVSAAA